jgi:hypothetical protein
MRGTPRQQERPVLLDYGMDDDVTKGGRRPVLENAIDHLTLVLLVRVPRFVAEYVSGTARPGRGDGDLFPVWWSWLSLFVFGGLALGPIGAHTATAHTLLACTLALSRRLVWRRALDASGVLNLQIRETVMTQPVLRLLIREKLAGGRLRHNSSTRFWGGPGQGEICDACDEAVTNDQRVIENRDPEGGGVQFHVACFYVWNVERQLLVPEPRRAAQVGSTNSTQARA